jgi:phage host-nuclease inhibitor protein Gam
VMPTTEFVKRLRRLADLSGDDMCTILRHAATLVEIMVQEIKVLSTTVATYKRALADAHLTNTYLRKQLDDKTKELVEREVQVNLLTKKET